MENYAFEEAERGGMICTGSEISREKVCEIYKDVEVRCILK